MAIRLQRKVWGARRFRACATGLAVVMAVLALPAAHAGADSVESATVIYGVSTGTEVMTVQGSESNCTRDENYGTFTTTASADEQTISMTAKNGGSCALERSYNVWRISLPNVKVMHNGHPATPHGDVWFGHELSSPFYYARCGAWLGYRCMIPAFHIENTNKKVEILPPGCGGAVKPGEICSEWQLSDGQPTPAVKADFATDNKHFMTIENAGSIGCMELGPHPDRRQFIPANSSVTHLYNGGGTWQFDAAVDRRPGKYGRRCIVVFHVS